MSKENFFDTHHIGSLAVPGIVGDAMSGFERSPGLLPGIPKDQNLADEFHRRLLCWINDFHQALADEYEVGGQLASFGKNIEFHFTDISWWNPSLISFIGTLEDGSPVELIQHVSQINVLLIRKKRLNLDEPKRPIGFASWDAYEEFKN